MRWLKTIDPVVQSVSGWATLVTIVLTGFYSLIGFLSPAFEGLHWTMVVLLGIVMSLGTLLVLAVIAAIVAWVFRPVKPVSTSAIADELDRTKERLKRAEERLDGAQVVPAVGESHARRRPNLTIADRERIGEMIRDVVDFVDGDLQTFQTSLVRAICGSNPPDIAAVEPLLAVQMDLARRALALHQKHSHYSDLIELDLIQLYRVIGNIREPMTAALEAMYWPAAAQAERCGRLNNAFSELGTNMRAVEASLAEKRIEFIDNAEVAAAESQPKPLRLSRAEQERVTDRLIKLDDYLADDIAAIMQPIRELLGWQEHLRHVGAGQLNSEVEAMRQPIARQIREVGQNLVSYQADTDVLGLNPMAIKTKFVPMNDALRDFTDITQALAEDSIHWSPLVMPGRQLSNVVGELTDEIDRVRRDVAEWRKRIAQGELD